jgi:hypothetical protein
MIKYRQHRPTFFEGFENLEGEVANLEELLKLEFITNFTQTPGFHRFSRGTEVDSPEHHGILCTLMAEYQGGYEWWVVAYLWPGTAEELAGLPRWEAKYKDKAKKNNGKDSP